MYKNWRGGGPLSPLLSVSIHCDALILLILAVCHIDLRHCLLCLRFLTDWCNYTSGFTFFSLLIIVGYLFFCSSNSRLVTFCLFFFEICIPCHLKFYCYLCCSSCYPVRVCERFPFWIITFWVRFFGVIWACVEPLSQHTSVTILMV